MEYVRGRLGLTLLASEFIEVYTRHPGALAFGTFRERDRGERERERKKNIQRDRQQN